MTDRDMTDRELLELAAKAAGIGPIVCYEKERNCLRIGYRTSYHIWRPLSNDSDAMRLAAACRLTIRFWDDEVVVDGTETDVSTNVKGRHAYVRAAAARRAITRAAAAMAEGGV